MITPPRELELLAQRMFQDLGVVATNEDELFRWLLGDFDQPAAKRLATFLDTVASSTDAQRAVVAFWSRSRCDWLFKSEGDLFTFLGEVRRRLTVAYSV